MSSSDFEVPYYQDYISKELRDVVLADADQVEGIEGLKIIKKPSSQTSNSLETKEAFRFLVTLYRKIAPRLQHILSQRTKDREFIDARCAASFDLNQALGIDLLNPRYRTVLGLEDSAGRVVFGPKREDFHRPSGEAVAPIPDFLAGPHITLFGPPDSAKRAINAMNSYHRKLKDEPEVISSILSKSSIAPFWGADDEDSKTPIHAHLVDSATNLTACFAGNIRYRDPATGEDYELAKDHRAQPIKRFPGLALPCTFLFLNGSPLPLHLYEFALHFFHNWHNPRALTFYVPKLENEEEASYIHSMVRDAEEEMQILHPSYRPGTIRLMIIMENPRAILRCNEIIDALHPYFAGASLGWHDYLASTARLFKSDGNYRIPVKADPNIVIKYIHASHRMLADVVGARGGIKVGGMYGVLPNSDKLFSPSFQTTLKGFIKDVITQMKRNLTGFWVAHPDFVRLGIALVEAWRERSHGDSESLMSLLRATCQEPHLSEISNFINSPDIQGLDQNDPNYVRSLIVTDIRQSDFIANNDPAEIRYNVFQSLQYLADWLSGNGCVALPTAINGVPARVMDDLATAERSRWEVWHEIYHKRFPVEQFLRIAFEELNCIRKDLSTETKIVNIKWDSRTAQWYPVAFHLMLLLMTAKKPVEFATELLLPFTIPQVRNLKDPLGYLQDLNPSKFVLPRQLARWVRYFESCSSERFATHMARYSSMDLELAREVISSFSLQEIKEAAAFHGTIGEERQTLDSKAAREQAGALTAESDMRAELRALGERYQNTFGFKFLISASGKSAAQLKEALEKRIERTLELEMLSAKEALADIAVRRLSELPLDKVRGDVREVMSRNGVRNGSISIIEDGVIQDISEKESRDKLFQIASLSKTLGAVVSLELLRASRIPLDSSVNKLLEEFGSPFRLDSDKVMVVNLINHSALNLHYVNGISIDTQMPDILELLRGSRTYNYEPVRCLNPQSVGERFSYSGGGFMVLEHLALLIGKCGTVEELTAPFFKALGAEHVTFAPKPRADHIEGHFDSGDIVPGGHLMFPAFAAGGAATASDLCKFLLCLEAAFHNVEGSGPISHDTAVVMLSPTNRGVNRGSRLFIGADQGLGVFVAETEGITGNNKFALHHGANEGFRALYLHCFSGPDRGRGFTILLNADNKGVKAISEIAQLLSQHLQFEGMDFSRFCADFKSDGVPQAQIVNLGLKKLVFDALIPSLPERCSRRRAKDRPDHVDAALANFNLCSLATISDVSNQRFARAENLLSIDPPEFDPSLFGRQGKIMDSWESERHNQEGVDYVEFDFKDRIAIGYVSLSTEFHDGNHPDYVRVLAKDKDSDWCEIIPKIPLSGHSRMRVKLPTLTQLFSRCRVEMYPDGGLSRIGIYRELPFDLAATFQELPLAQPKRFDYPVPTSRKPLSLPFDKSMIPQSREQDGDRACSMNGGEIVSVSNEHYGPASQVTSPFMPLNMFDGFESARSRKPDHYEEIVIKLGGPLRPIRSIVFDFSFFINNNPRALQVFSTQALQTNEWREVVGYSEVKAFAGNTKKFEIDSLEPVGYVKVRVFPDGGINRIRVY